jgi:hypothetical protein
MGVSLEVPVSNKLFSALGGPKKDRFDNISLSTNPVSLDQAPATRGSVATKHQHWTMIHAIHFNSEHWGNIHLGNADNTAHIHMVQKHKVRTNIKNEQPQKSKVCYMIILA